MMKHGFDEVSTGRGDAFRLTNQPSLTDCYLKVPMLTMEVLLKELRIGLKMKHQDIQAIAPLSKACIRWR